MGAEGAQWDRVEGVWSQPEAPGMEAGLTLLSLSLSLVLALSLSLSYAVHPLSWGRPQGECMVCGGPQRPLHPGGILHNREEGKEWGGENPLEPGMWIFQTQPWPRKACSEDRCVLGNFLDAANQASLELGVLGSKNQEYFRAGWAQEDT